MLSTDDLPARAMLAMQHEVIQGRKQMFDLQSNWNDGIVNFTLLIESIV